MNKCKECQYGAIAEGFWNSIYKFKEAYKIFDNNLICISYENDECGCRLTEWNDKQKKCLSNNFSEFKEFSLENK